MKKLISLFLSMLLLLGISVPAWADNMESCAVIGANLSDEQVAQVYEYFGIKRGSVPELIVTNAEERKYLEGLVSEAVIGRNSISCVYVELLEEGSGIEVSTHNISWCTSDMYKSALETAGITDARIIVAAPFQVSGTAALTGVYKAYEHLTGSELDNEAKQASTEELTITGELSDLIGSEDAAAVISEVKDILNETGKMSDDELRAAVKQIAYDYDLVLNDSELSRIVQWCRKLEKLDIESIVEQVNQIQETVGKVSKAKDNVVSFAAKVNNFFVTLSGYVDTVKGWFSK
ncbi:MAG: DUF1002 domain-containing protein [Oscillospiraceae bacterium]|nr:DUF1002 domain-containing protein [Oscillospiraceae bacterium]